MIFLNSHGCTSLKLNQQLFKHLLSLRYKLNCKLVLKLKLFNLIGVGVLRSNITFSLVWHCSPYFMPHNPQQIGHVERKDRYIVELVILMFFHAYVPLKYWDEAFYSSSFVINCLPFVILGYKTPLEVLFNTKPDYQYFKVFGCLCYPFTRAYNSNKLEPRSIPCTFLGYSPKHKGYECLSSSGRLYVSRDVVFEESNFPF